MTHKNVTLLEIERWRYFNATHFVYIFFALFDLIFKLNMIKSRAFVTHLVNRCSKLFKDMNWIQEAHYKGNDLYGNHFFETKYKNGRVRRFAESKGLEINSEQWKTEISPEWESWLRYSRQKFILFLSSKGLIKNFFNFLFVFLFSNQIPKR